MRMRKLSRAAAPAAASSPGCPHCGAPGQDLDAQNLTGRDLDGQNLARRELGGLDWTASGGGRPGKSRRRWRRLRRRARRLLAIVVALGLLGGVMFAGLLIVAPSVGNAPALARTLDQAHHAVYPGPPVPQQFAASLVATEDHRFYAEAGIDPFAMARATAGYLTGKPDQGGSTLNQQLAKILYVPGHAGLMAKGEQVLLGVKLALAYSKTEMLQMYADVAYFGHGYYGLQAASCGYFRVPPAALTWAQAALLAGLVQAPSVDDPLAHLSLAKAREALVLGRLAATGTLTPAQAERDYRQPLHLTSGRRSRCASA